MTSFSKGQKGHFLPLYTENHKSNQIPFFFFLYHFIFPKKKNIKLLKFRKYFIFVRHLLKMYIFSRGFINTSLFEL